MRLEKEALNIGKQKCMTFIAMFLLKVWMVFEIKFLFHMIDMKR
jgi:hypothetical protein